MTADATFEDGTAKPLRLVAMDDEDLQVLSDRATAMRPEIARLASQVNAL